jgi:hypothetical protein
LPPLSPALPRLSTRNQRVFRFRGCPHVLPCVWVVLSSAAHHILEKPPHPLRYHLNAKRPRTFYGCWIVVVAALGLFFSAAPVVVLPIASGLGVSCSPLPLVWA